MVLLIGDEDGRGLVGLMQQQAGEEAVTKQLPSITNKACERK